MFDLQEFILMMGLGGTLRKWGEEKDTSEESWVFSPICWHHLTLLTYVNVCQWKFWFYSDSVWTKCSLSLSFFSLIPFYDLSSSPFFPPLLPAFLPPFFPCSTGSYLKLSGRWQAWIDVEVYSWGNILSILPASKNDFQTNLSSHVFHWSVRMRGGKNTLALPEKGFGKNQVYGNEWSKALKTNLGVQLKFFPACLT